MMLVTISMFPFHVVATATRASIAVRGGVFTVSWRVGMARRSKMALVFTKWTIKRTRTNVFALNMRFGMR